MKVFLLCAAVSLMLGLIGGIIYLFSISVDQHSTGVVPVLFFGGISTGIIAAIAGAIVRKRVVFYGLGAFLWLVLALIAVDFFWAVIGYVTRP